MTTANGKPDGRAMRNLRVLCLHGYHGSASILRGQMAALAAAAPSNVEFVYVDAPSLSRDDFGWWHEGFIGWEHTCDWATELLRTGPRVDGIFGFSQGAALTGLLAAMRDSRPAPVEFEFAIMVRGFTSFAPQHAGLFSRKLSVPSVHVTGRADDGTPRTKHVTTNITINVDDAAGTATSRAYFTVLQALPGLALQPIARAATTTASTATTGSGASPKGSSTST
jgi:hypothetical protein